jgi:hypothetical protein
MKKMNLILVALTILLVVPAVYAAISTTTQVGFNVGTLLAYTLTLPGESAVNANSTGAPTTAIEFNSTTGTSSNVNAKVVGGSTQSDGTPIFEFDNTGTVNLNISVRLNSGLPACMTLQGATTYAGADTGATISTSDVSVVTSFTPAAAAQEWYMKADFSSCVAGDTTSRTLTSEGVQS